ncbi:hypothetical protein B0H14DRAFT_2588776 [Mycena olivaceomarginata]|nr:hypothetical protein B0H14DRAFT_2588776 [Mycena olivaceomarginata]
MYALRVVESSRAPKSRGSQTEIRPPELLCTCSDQAGMYRFKLSREIEQMLCQIQQGKTSSGLKLIVEGLKALSERAQAWLNIGDWRSIGWGVAECGPGCLRDLHGKPEGDSSGPEAGSNSRPPQGWHFVGYSNNHSTRLVEWFCN